MNILKIGVKIENDLLQYFVVFDMLEGDLGSFLISLRGFGEVCGARGGLDPPNSPFGSVPDQHLVVY